MTEAATFDISTPEAIAAARAALDAEETRQREAAKANEEHAAAAARQAVEAAFRAEVASVLGPAKPVEAARAAALEAKRRHQAALDARAEAEAEIAAAKGRLHDLVEQSVGGAWIEAAAVAEAHAAVSKHEQHAAFLAVVAGRLAAPIEAAKAAVRAALAEQHEPLFRRGADLRIEAAAMAEKAASAATGHFDRAAMDAALAVFKRGNRLMHLAAANHFNVMAVCPVGISETFPPTLALERQRWGRT